MAASLTVVYFTALVLGRQAAAAPRGVAQAMSVLAVFVASASWQLALAGSGAFLGQVLLTRKGSLTYYVVMTISHIQLISLGVADQDRALRFYVDMLGFDLVRDNPMGPGQRWVQVAPPGAQTSITLVTWFPTMPPGSTKGTVLESDDLDADVAALTAKGVMFEDGIQSQPWGRYVTFDDPDGNGIVLQETAASA